MSGVCLSEDAITLQGVGRFCSFMAQSIAYDPRTSTKKGYFLDPVLDHAGRFLSPNCIHFSYKLDFIDIYREIWCWTGRGGAQQRGLKGGGHKRGHRIFFIHRIAILTPLDSSYPWSVENTLKYLPRTDFCHFFLIIKYFVWKVSIKILKHFPFEVLWRLNWMRKTFCFSEVKFIIQIKFILIQQKSNQNSSRTFE